MDASMGGAGPGIALSLIGDALDRKQVRKLNALARKDAATERLHQKEFAQHGIRWKVEDARAAGLHPLYALGAQTAQYSPVHTQIQPGPSYGELGQNIGRSIAAQQTDAERQAQLLGIQSLQKGMEETDARINLLRAEEAKLRQEMDGAKALPVEVKKPYPIDVNRPSPFVTEDLARSHPLQGQVEIVPSELPTTKKNDSSVMAGEPGMWRKFDLGSGVGIYLPGGSKGDPAEALESLSESPLMAYMVYKENVARQGPEWGKEFRKRYLSVPIFGSFFDQVESYWNTMIIKARSDYRKQKR